jgi:DNA ligase (NAD+)
MKSYEIARVFERMADVLELRGENQFRIRAYRRAAQNLETLSEDVETLARAGKLRGLRGIQARTEQNILRGLDVADLYRLRGDQVRGLAGFGARAAENLIGAITASKARGLARVLHALGIRLVGAHVAGLLAERFGRLDAALSADAAELAAIRGVGPAIAESVAKFFAEPANRDVCRRLIAAGVSITHRTAQHGRGPLAGKTFVLTGALRALTRDQAAERIAERGGRVTGSVGRTTDYIVAGAAPGARARALDVPTLDERALLALLG